MPTFDTTSFFVRNANDFMDHNTLVHDYNEGVRISLYYFLVGNLCEVIILIYAMFTLRNI